MNTLTLHFKCTDCNGFPSAKILVDDQLVHDHKFSELQESLLVSLSVKPGDHVLTVERYNKQQQNFVFEDGKILKDQILEIVKLSVDGVDIPAYVVDSNCEFAYHDRVDAGSRYFGPNGVWTFKFQTPLIQYILDCRIEHESYYDQSYQFPWSYRHGPGTARAVIETIEQLEEKIQQIL